MNTEPLFRFDETMIGEEAKRQYKDVGDAILEATRKHRIAISDLTELQAREAFRQSIFREVERLKARIRELEEKLGNGPKRFGA